MASLLGVLEVSHIVVPWLVLARRLRRQEPTVPGPSKLASLPPPVKKGKKKRKGETKATPPVRAEPAVATTTHRCAKCGAPAPFADHPFACAHCNEELVPSPDVVAAYRNIVVASERLVRAELAWKRAVRWGSPAWVFLFWLVITAWSGTYAALVIARGSGPVAPTFSKLDLVFLFLSSPSGLFGWCLWMVLVNDLGKLGRILGKVPRRGLRSLPAQDGPCSHCGAPVSFDHGRLATICEYCAAEEVRPSLARPAAVEARTLAGAAHASILEAHAAIVNRRESLLVYIDVMALGSVALVGIYMISWIPGLERLFEWLP